VPPTLPQGITVAAPELCGKHEAYIRIERAIGARRLGTARNRGGAFDEGCMKLPANPADPSECPVLNPAPILGAAGERLRIAGIEGAGGAGLGPCGDMSGDYAAWNFAVGVVSWRDAARALTTVAELLATYDARGFVGVSVRGIPCVQLL
jgi:hypothetical protein